MIYPRSDHKPEVCRDCKGSGKVYDWEGTFLIQCDECNGTGIAGNPSLGCILAAVGVSLFWAGIYCWLS